MFRSTRKLTSNISSYHRLKVLNTSTSAFQRAKVSPEGEAQTGAAMKAAAHDEHTGASNFAGGLSYTVRGGSNSVEENGVSWNGSGILKTVDVSQTGVSAPEPANLPRAYIGTSRPMRHSQEALDVARHYEISKYDIQRWTKF